VPQCGAAERRRCLLWPRAAVDVHDRAGDNGETFVTTRHGRASSACTTDRLAACGGADCSKGCAKVALVQLLHNTNVPSCYAAADNRLRQSADWCRRCCRPPSLPLRVIRRRWLPALARIAVRTQSSGPTGRWRWQGPRRVGLPRLGRHGVPIQDMVSPPPRPAPPRPATPRHAMPRHATPCHATPRHATPRHATPVVRDLVAGPVPHWSGRCSSATSDLSAVATRPSRKAKAAAEAAAVPWPHWAVARDAWRTVASGAAAAKQFWRGRANDQKKEGYMYPSFCFRPPRTSLCSEVRGTAQHRRPGLRCLGGVAVGRFQGLVLNFRFCGKTGALMCCLGAVGLRARVVHARVSLGAVLRPRGHGQARRRRRRRGPLLRDRAAPG
jgi:hypothetical protein